jgi:ribose transport system permease protein
MAPTSSRIPTIFQGKSKRLNGVWLGGVLFVLIAVFSVLNPHAVLSAYNLRNIVSDASTLLIIAIGMTFVIATGGIDLSVGSILIFAQVVAAKAMLVLGGQGLLVSLVGTLVAIVAGGAWGLVNGAMVAKLRIPPLIATLGTLGVAGGSALLITNGVNIAVGIPDELTLGLGSSSIAGVIPDVAAVALAVVILAWITLSQTRFGMHVLGVGSNSAALQRAGIDVSRVRLLVYTLSGACSGLGAIVDLARFSTTTVGGHTTTSLEAIAAVVIGGTSLFGGVASIVGAVIGVFIPAVLRDGFVIVGIPSFWQQIAVGIILVCAVYVDQMRRA